MFPLRELLTIHRWSHLPFKPQVSAQALPPSRTSPTPQTTLGATFLKSSQMPPVAAVARKPGEFCLYLHDSIDEIVGQLPVFSPAAPVRN